MGSYLASLSAAGGAEGVCGRGHLFGTAAGPNGALNEMAVQEGTDRAAAAKLEGPLVH